MIDRDNAWRRSARRIKHLLALSLAGLAVASVIEVSRPGLDPCQIPANHGPTCKDCERLRAAWATVDDEAFWQVAEAAGLRSDP